MTDPSRQALVLVDVVPPSPDDPDIFQRLSTALAVARDAGFRVVHVWSAPPGAPPPPTDPAIEPRRGEPVLPNPGTGAWGSAGLGRTLAAGGVESIVLAGRPDSPAWWPTVEESAAQPIALTVLSDRRPEHDLRVRQLIERGPGRPGARLVDAGAWVAETTGRWSGTGSSRRRWRLLGALGVLVLLLAGGAAVINHDANGYYEFAPGTAPAVTASPDCKVRNSSSTNLTLPTGAPCARLIIPGDKAHQVDGRLFMVDVLVGPASPVDFVLHKLGLLNTFHKGNQLVPASAVLGTTPPSQLGCLDAQQMTGSTQDATVAALQRLGYPVKENDLGALVVQVSPGSAAAAAGVQCNDVITALDGTAVHTYTDLVDAIHSRHPGDKVTITVKRPGPNATSSTKTLTATLSGTPAEPAADGNPASPADPSKAFLGVGTQTQLTYTLPFNVSIQVGDIGGPSAGLALTLGLLDTLSNGQLTGGKAVAATGTIAPDGTVGDVGGVAQKTIAVRRAGADVFLVPAAEYATAKREAGNSLKIVPVTSLNGALADLEHLGGNLGRLSKVPSTTTTTTPPTTVP
ncbi:PDZ domain-containing protein [Acidiferrimicrobium sp. IK]|uniref:PDZ domain-containing protein n=1 Tax=Acidiferrimicrobium sp. IK TaxID=2871700 RepID=UPI0021CB4DE8|nr:PDZ domain-containing protein [Acidiferrimicrobium sp. IK]MCU4185110.1 PDZ domain-containing protein [Acidiferrimicrobium sp. IK]